jgi:hypothetical protein
LDIPGNASGPTHENTELILTTLRQLFKEIAESPMLPSRGLGLSVSLFFSQRRIDDRISFEVPPKPSFSAKEGLQLWSLGGSRASLI